jgi:hypothetical protein
MPVRNRSVVGYILSALYDAPAPQDSWALWHATSERQIGVVYQPSDKEPEPANLEATEGEYLP